MIFPLLAQITTSPTPTTVVFNLEPLVNALVPLVAALVLEIVRRAWKERSAARERLIGSAAHLAYLVTAEVAALTPNAVDDKVAHAMGVFARALESKRAAPASEAEKEQVQIAWKAMHGQEKLAEQGILPPK